MTTIRREDKMIASSLHPDIAPRAPAPSGTESRPRKPIALLLSGLILIGGGAPPVAETACATPAIASKYEKCIKKGGYLLYRMDTRTQADLDRYALLYCSQRFKGEVLSKEDKNWLSTW
jgi:hypothetical protein